MSTRITKACPRCGIRRVVKPDRTGDLCRDCWSVEPGWPNSVKDAMKRKVA